MFFFPTCTTLIRWIAVKLGQGIFGYWHADHNFILPWGRKAPHNVSFGEDPPRDWPDIEYQASQPRAIP